MRLDSRTTAAPVARRAAVSSESDDATVWPRGPSRTAPPAAARRTASLTARAPGFAGRYSPRVAVRVAV